MRIHSRELDAPPLVRDWLGGRDPAASFFPGDPRGESGFRDVAARRDDGFGRAERERVAAALGGGGPDGPERLRRFVEEEGFVVTTGQQAVLFGGPLFVLHKALTTVALAARLEGTLERPVLPVFWIASEDHDWKEAREVSLLDPGNELRTVRVEAEPDGTPALHRFVPGPPVQDALRAFLEHLPDSDFAPRWRALLEAAYAPDETLPGGFARTLAGLLGDRGLFHLQAHEPSLKAATSGLLLAELEGSARTEALLRDRVRKLEDAGYEARVPVLEGAANLLFEGSRGRERLVREEGAFRLRRTGERLALEEIREAVREDPARLSPNVLLRPVVESAFLPTLAYVGGPSELAYLAEAAPLFEHHGVVRPLVHPRFSGEVRERKVEKVLEKYSLDSAALARPHHEVAGSLAREELPDPVRRALGEFRGALARHAGPLAEAVAGIDPTLREPAEQVRNRGFDHLDEVERKVLQALKRENRIALAQVEKAQRHLYPEGVPQERVLSFWYHLFRYGDRFLDELAEAVEEAVREGPAPLLADSGRE